MSLLAPRSIPRQSEFEVKSIAGNIIPAIATTNAIVAGLQVLEGIKLLEARGADGTYDDEANKRILENCHYTFCIRKPSGWNKLLVPATLRPPNKRCFVCGTAQLTLTIDTANCTLKDLWDKVRRGRRGGRKGG